MPSYLISLKMISILSYLIHLIVCLTTGPKPLPKRALQIMRCRASSFKWEYSILSLRSYNSFLRLLPCLPVTSIPPCIFPSVIRCRRQFLRKIWPIQFAFRLRISCRIFLCSLTLNNTSSFLTWSVQLIFSILLHHHISKLSRCFWSTARSVQVSAPYKARKAKVSRITYVNRYFSMAQQPMGQGLLIIEASRSHSDTSHSVGLLWISDQPDLELCLTTHNTQKKNRQPCPRWDSNPQSQ